MLEIEEHRCRSCTGREENDQIAKVFHNLLLMKLRKDIVEVVKLQLNSFVGRPSFCSDIVHPRSAWKRWIKRAYPQRSGSPPQTQSCSMADTYLPEW